MIRSSGRGDKADAPQGGRMILSGHIALSTLIFGLEADLELKYVWDGVDHSAILSRNMRSILPWCTTDCLCGEIPGIV